ncbi:MAG: type II toxin-antitoxin system RelB/DinJ family antitoxin [Patescibacteria group bacterium]
MTTLIHVRVPEDMKTKATKIFAKLGIDMSTGIKIYLNKVVEEKGIPFPLQTREALIQELKEARAQYERGEFISSDELRARIAKKAA